MNEAVLPNPKSTLSEANEVPAVKRQVRIAKRSYRGWQHWAVEYLDRKKCGRYCAGYFDARRYGVDVVIEWVKSKPRLELVSVETNL